MLVDQSLAEIGLTLWGSVAEKFDPEEEHPVLAVKGAKVTDYSGISLTALASSVIQVFFTFFRQVYTRGATLALPGSSIFVRFLSFQSDFSSK